MAKYTKEESEKAIDLYIRYCKEATKVKFITLSQLATRLLAAKETGRIEKALGDFRALDLLDEWGYCQLDKMSSELVFQVIADSSEHKSLILTTNLPFSEWGKIVADEQLAAAMIDRIVHFGHLIDTGKVDWRLRLSPMNHQMVEKKIN